MNRYHNEMLPKMVSKIMCVPLRERRAISKNRIDEKRRFEAMLQRNMVIDVEERVTTIKMMKKNKRGCFYGTFGRV